MIFEADDRLVVTDTETFGLDPEQDPLLEVGILVSDLDFNILSTYDVLIWEKDLYETCFENLARRARDGDESAEYVIQMHTDSGLWEAARRDGVNPKQAENWLLQHADEIKLNRKDPMVGSTIGFDRNMLRFQMPLIHDRFHYRDINISSVKELCRRFNPTLYQKMEEAWKSQKVEAHRALSDCRDSLNELKFYVDNFLFTEEGDW